MTEERRGVGTVATDETGEIRVLKVELIPTPLARTMRCGCGGMRMVSIMVMGGTCSLCRTQYVYKKFANECGDSIDFVDCHCTPEFVRGFPEEEVVEESEAKGHRYESFKAVSKQ